MIESFAAPAAVLWASFAAGLGYLGGKTFEDDPVLGLASALTLAAAIAVAGELVRRLRRPQPCAAC